MTGGTDIFAPHENELACWQQGQWVFMAPASGMSVYDRNLDAMRHFKGTWSKPTAIDLPSGGSTVDTQARTAIDQILSILRASGHLPNG